VVSGLKSPLPAGVVAIGLLAALGATVVVVLVSVGFGAGFGGVGGATVVVVCVIVCFLGRMFYLSRMFDSRILQA